MHDHRGEKNPRWKGGRSEQWYRRIMAEARIPVMCVECEGVDKLQIHHKNRNHTDNGIENLEFRCARCHSKMHPRTLSEEHRKKISESLKRQYATGDRKTHENFVEMGKKTRFRKGMKPKGGFKKGMVPWWKKRGYKSVREAMDAKKVV